MNDRYDNYARQLKFARVNGVTVETTRYSTAPAMTYLKVPVDGERFIVIIDPQTSAELGDIRRWSVGCTNDAGNIFGTQLHRVPGTKDLTWVVDAIRTITKEVTA